MPTSPGSCWCKFGLEADMRESIFFKWLLQIVNLLIFSQRDSIRNRTGMEIDATQQHKCRQNCLKYGQNDTKHCGVYMLFCIADFGGRSRGGGNEADWHRDRGQVHTPVPAQLARLWPQLEAVPALNLKDQVQLELEVASVTRTAAAAAAAHAALRAGNLDSESTEPLLASTRLITTSPPASTRRTTRSRCSR